MNLITCADALSQLLIKHGKDFLKLELSVKKGFVFMTSPPLVTEYYKSPGRYSGPIFCSWVVRSITSGANVTLLFYGRIVPE